jgi:cation diffusion facilitator family transporter
MMPRVTALRSVRRILWQILVVNLLVAAAKMAVGIATGSISMVADGFHSTLDGSSNVIGLIGLAIAARPPDDSHPYGHWKFETFAALAIGLLLLLAGWNVLISTVERFADSSTPQVGPVNYTVMVITLIANSLVTVYESRQGHRLKSDVLLADAAHTRSDILVSLSVIIGLTAVSLGYPWMDGLVALLIVVFIAYTGWQIIRRASAVLADSAVLEVAEVERIVLSVPGVRSCHRVRSRGTSHATYLDLHIQVNGQLPLAESHALGHAVQAELRRRLRVIDVMVHVEPVPTDETEQ